MRGPVNGLPIRHGRSRGAPSVRFGAPVFSPVLVLALSVAIAYWPSVSADWIRDDYRNLAVARMVGPPWALFVTDHFHAPAPHFRPLAYFPYWPTQALFGAGPTAQ